MFEAYKNPRKALWKIIHVRTSDSMDDEFDLYRVYKWDLGNGFVFDFLYSWRLEDTFLSREKAVKFVKSQCRQEKLIDTMYFDEKGEEMKG